MEAIAAAAASLSVAAASGATSISSATSSPRSPRPASPGTGRRADGSEIEEDLLATPSLPSRESGSSAMAAAIPVGAVVPPHTLQPNLEIAEHAKLQAQADDVKNGRHPKMIDEKAVQGTLQRRRLDNAREVYQLLMTNVEELRQAEFRDSDVQTKLALERTQEELLDDVHQRIRKAKVDGKVVQPPKRASSGIASGVGGDGVGEKSDDCAGNALLGRKRARLMPARGFEKITPEAVLAKAEARRIRTLTLSDIEMRRDFRTIITDWRERATKYLSTYNNSHWTKVTVSPDSFRVRGVTFAKGDPVIVTSRVTGEEFHGEITVVKPKAVFLSLYGGVKTRIFVDHLSTGRLTVARADANSAR